MENTTNTIKCAFCKAVDINDNNEYSCLVPMRNTYGIKNGVGRFDSMKHAIMSATKAYKDFVFVCLDKYTTKNGEVIPCVVLAEISSYENEHLYDNKLF